MPPLQLREECLLRLEAARSRILNASRQARTAGQPGVQDALRNIISDSSAHLQQEDTQAKPAPAPATGVALPSMLTPAQAPFHARPTPTTQVPPDDQIMHSNIDTHSFGNSRQLSPFGEEPAELSKLSHEEYFDLMQFLEESLYEDTLREEADYLDSLEQRDVDNMVEAHLGRMGLSEIDEEDAVLCPLCQETWLLQRQGVILCPRRHLRLDTAIEGLQLRDLKERLAAVLENHARQRCCGQVVFEQTGVPGMHSLMLKCDTCGAIELVM